MKLIALTDEECVYLQSGLEVFRSAHSYSIKQLKNKEYSVNNIISLSQTELNDKINTQILEKLKC